MRTKKIMQPHAANMQVRQGRNTPHLRETETSLSYHQKKFPLALRMVPGFQTACHPWQVAALHES